MSKPGKQNKTSAPPFESGPFPSVRYFQVHFEYLHEQLQFASRQMAALAEQVQGLEAQLARQRETTTPWPAEGRADVRPVNRRHSS